MAEHKIPYEEVLPEKRSSVPKFDSAERTNLWEMFQFDRWTKVAKQMTKGNSSFFERFFNEMMPLRISYTWENIDHRTHRKIRVFKRGNSSSQDELLFTYTGPLRTIFQKMVDHYGTNRESYFEQRYHTKFLKVSLEKAMRIALNPPEPEIIEKEKEVLVEVEKKVPGEIVDRLEEQMTQIWNFFTSNQVNRNKALPNRFRNIDNVDVNYNQTKGMTVLISLKG